MHKLLPIILLSSLVGASTIQQPLANSPISNTLTTKKPLVDSESLQSHITSANLLKRAKHLFQIAELGIDEYNHPTRVIGSEGTIHHLATSTNLPLYHS